MSARAASPVAALRHAAGLTQVELARRMGITQPSVAQMEGAGYRVQADTLLKVAAACGRKRVVLRVAP